MIRYGSEQISDLQFQDLRAFIEPRDHQWVDVELRFHTGGELPPDLTDLTALLICTRSGDIFQIVPQDEGRDCEYQFTETEKAKLRSYYEEQVRPQLLQKIKAEV